MTVIGIAVCLLLHLMLLDKMKKKIFLIIGILLVLTINMSFAMAVASFAVTSFSCTPSEAVINNVFSCTAQIKNNGDASGSVSTATLYPDSGNWLENSNYPQSSGTTVAAGQSTEVTFTGLKAIKSGNNGFSKITLDSVTDNYVADNSVKVNVVNVVVTVSDSVSSAAMGSTFDSTASVTAGGNIDVTLTFTVNSGGCSIGSQPSQKTISSMQEGNTQSRTWTVTEGTSGSCRYTISAAATGVGGVASKTDSTSSTVTCTDCPVSSTTTTSSSSSGGGGGGGGGAIVLGELVLGESQTKELLKDGKIKFNISDVEHTLALVDFTDTQATITIESEKQTITLAIGEEAKIDLDKDSIYDVSIKLKSINSITKKVTFVLTRISESIPVTGKAIKETGEAVKEGEKAGEEVIGRGGKGGTQMRDLALWIGGIVIVLAVIVVVLLNIKKTQKKTE